MPEEYSTEQLWKLYSVLPKELQEALFSEDTAESIYNAGTKNGLQEKQISDVAKYTSYVLMGLLPPDEFQKTLEFKLALTNQQAKKINQEITRFVFFPLRATLENIYKTEVGQVPKPSEKTYTPEEITGEAPKEKKPPSKRLKKDVYRESL